MATINMHNIKSIKIAQYDTHINEIGTYSVITLETIDSKGNNEVITIFGEPGIKLPELVLSKGEDNDEDRALQEAE